MYVIVNNKNKVIATSSGPVSVDDCATRGEIVVQTDEDVKVGYLYENGVFVPSN